MSLLNSSQRCRELKLGTGIRMNNRNIANMVLKERIKIIGRWKHHREESEKKMYVFIMKSMHNRKK